MPVERRKGSPYWYARFQINGKRYFLSTDQTNKRKAEEFEKTERSRIEKEGDQPVAAMTVEAALGRYWHESGQYQKGNDVLRHLNWLQERLGKKTLLRSLSMRELSAVVAQRRAGGVSNATVNRSVVEPLRRVLNRARDMWNEPVPTIQWKMLKLREPPGRIREASEDEEALVVAAAREEYRPAIHFAILSGFRRTEIVKLRWSDVDWKAKKISVLGKGDIPATIPMSSAIEAVLVPLVGQHPEFVFTYIKRRKRRGEPLPGSRVPIPPMNLYHRHREACALAGVSNLKLHDLRHTTGSRITRAGGIRIAMDLLRHKDIKTTMRYAHVLDGDVKKAMETASQNRITPTYALPKSLKSNAK